jgi:ubiquinone/menaquinone biosynthesis C-methylase UbiE
VSADNVNRRIYEEQYTPAQLEAKPETPYDARMIALRHAIIGRWVDGRDILDLGCGTGTYLAQHVAACRSAVGLDFSPQMLQAFAERFDGEPPPQLRLIEGDMTDLPLVDASIDLAFSFSALYYVPGLDQVLREVRRVLRPEGRAVLELGNLHSLNTLVCNVQHVESGWAKPEHVSYAQMRLLLAQAGLVVERWRAFQLLPMYGSPRRLLWLAPLLSPRWKRLLGHELGGRLADEWLSSAPLLRRLAFRHLVEVRPA